MSIARLWAGRAFGTNTGNLFVELTGEDRQLAGVLRFADDKTGLVTYGVAGSFDGTTLQLIGEVQTTKQGVEYGQLTAVARLEATGSLRGEWRTAIGSAGTFELHPHRSVEEIDTDSTPQLHIARADFGAISIDRAQILALADDIQRDFTSGKVAISVKAGTEQGLFLDDFRGRQFAVDRAEEIRVIAQEQDARGATKAIKVEFGPQSNYVMVQSADEAWALGRRETLRQSIGRHQRTYATNIRWLWGIGISQLLFLALIVYLPALPELLDRVVFTAAMLVLAQGVLWLHKRYLPLAVIQLGPRSQGLLSRVGQQVLSWFIAVLATAVAAVLAVHIQALLDLVIP